MGRITKLEKQKGGARRISVFVNDRFVAGLSPNAVRDLDLSPGMEVSGKLYAQVIYESARESALMSLARREHSRAELAAKLKQKKFPGNTIKAALDELEKRGQLDDRRFARAWIEHRNAYYPRGRRMLALELKQKGVSSEVAAEALAEQLPESGERELLINLIRKRLRTSSRSDPERFKRRLLGFLARRGFSYGEIRSVLVEHFPEL